MANADEQPSEASRIRSIVSDLVVSARQRAGNAEQLATELDRLGINGERGPYSPSAISNWAKGRTMPPGDVLLAVALVAEESIDRKLSPTATAIEPDGANAELRGEVARLQAEMRHLYARFGEPYDQADNSTTRLPDRDTGTG